MRKEFKLASVAGAIMMVSGMAQAALPGSGTADPDAVRFQDIMDSSGNISNPDFCDDGAGNCFQIAKGDGFLQLMVAGQDGQVAGGIPTGEVFIYTFIGEDPSGTQPGTFRDISFVNMSSNSSGTGSATSKPGIYGRQTISEPDSINGGSFYSETNLVVGAWAKAETTADADITLIQTLEDSGGTPTAADAGDDFRTSFEFASITTQDATTGEVTVSKKMDISQWLGLQDMSSDAAKSITEGDAQAFAYRSMVGSYNPTAGSAGVGSDASQRVSWSAGDHVAATWIGQSLTIPTTDNTDVFMPSDFAYLSYQNKDTGDMKFKVSFAKNDAVYNFDSNGDQLWKAELSDGTEDAAYFGFEPCLTNERGWVLEGGVKVADPACTKTN